MMGQRRGGQVVVEIGRAPWRPVAGRRREETWRGRRHGGWVRFHEVQVVGVVMVVVARHEQLGLVLVGGRVGGRRLHRLRQAGEVELVGVALAVHLRHDVLVVVVTQGATQLVVVHVRLVLALAPALRHLVRVDHLELAVRALPLDARHVVAVRQQLEQELPQLDLTAACNTDDGHVYDKLIGLPNYAPFCCYYLAPQQASSYVRYENAMDQTVVLPTTSPLTQSMPSPTSPRFHQDLCAQDVGVTPVAYLGSRKGGGHGGGGGGGKGGQGGGGASLLRH